MSTTTSVSIIYQPVPSTCAQIIANGDFQNPNREFFPWIVAANTGVSGGVGTDDAASNPNQDVWVFFEAAAGTGTSIGQIQQGVSSCGRNYVLSFRYKRLITQATPYTWTVEARWEVTGASAGPVSVSIVPGYAWATVQFAPMALPASGGRLIINFSVGSRTTAASIVVDDIRLTSV
jgi:hypothetical protein